MLDSVKHLKFEYKAIKTFKNQKTWCDFAYGVVLPRYDGRSWWTPQLGKRPGHKRSSVLNHTRFATELRESFTRREFLEFAERVTRQLPRPKGL